MARSAMPGWSVGSDISMFTCRYSLIELDLGIVRDEAATFGYPRALVLNSGSKTLVIRDRRRIERRVTASLWKMRE